MRKTFWILFFTCFTAANHMAYAQFAGGTGTADDPWQIANLDHLNNVRNYLGEEHGDKHFKQTDDILDGSGFFGAIGTADEPFQGNYDGDHRTIKNIVISAPQANYQGIFGYVSEAVLRNIQFENIEVAGSRYVGGLVGYAENSFIENITITGEILSYDREAGGLAGVIDGGLVFNVSTNVSVTGGYRSGGLAGLLQNEGEIRYAHSHGSVNGANDAGGFAGSISSDGLVTDCYSHASVDGENHVGGFTGNLNHSRHLYRSFSTGAVSGTGDNVGGFIGTKNLAHSATYCFWDVQSSGMSTSAGDADGVTGFSTDEMLQQNSFPMFNFMSAWQIDEGNDYPELQDFTGHLHPTHIDISQLSGSGTTNDPYLINDANELNTIHQDLSANYILGTDISLASSVIWNFGKGWQAIGTEVNPFTGSFDGDGFKIEYLTLNRPGSENMGLFGYTQGGGLKNIVLENVHIKGNDHTGGLVGYAENSDVENCSVKGHVVSSWGYIGGMLGYVSNGEINHVWSDVTVFGGVKTTSQIGGLIGTARDGASIQYSFSHGSVVSGGSAGGFAGGIAGNQTVLSDNFSHASVNGDTRVGGFAGTTNFGLISNSYSTGEVNGNSDVGGFLGYFYGQGADNCYWDIETSAQNSSSGGSGVNGRSTLEMTYPHSQDTYVGWDFAIVWDDDATGEVNSGYPYLRETGGSTGINPETGNNLSVSVYPNPASSYFYVDCGNLDPEEGYTLFIYNTTGRIVYETPVRQQVTFVDVSAARLKGVYFINLINYRDKTSAAKKILFN
jgi:hypothetical protein